MPPNVSLVIPEVLVVTPKKGGAKLDGEFEAALESLAASAPPASFADVADLPTPALQTEESPQPEAAPADKRNPVELATAPVIEALAAMMIPVTPPLISSLPPPAAAVEPPPDSVVAEAILSNAPVAMKAQANTPPPVQAAESFSVPAESDEEQESDEPVQLARPQTPPAEAKEIAPPVAVKEREPATKEKLPRQDSAGQMLPAKAEAGKEKPASPESVGQTYPAKLEAPPEEKPQLILAEKNAPLATSETPGAKSVDLNVESTAGTVASLASANDAPVTVEHEAASRAEKPEFAVKVDKGKAVPVGATPPARPAVEAAPTVATPATQKLPEPLRPVVMTVRSAAARGEDEVRLQLQPESMGRVEVRLRYDGAEVRVHLAAETAQTGALLQHHAPDLRAALAEAGVTVSQLSVAVGDGRSPGSQSAFDSPNRQAFTPGGAGERAPHESAATPARLVSARPVSSSRVDYRV